jgi:hypothetical protein
MATEMRVCAVDPRDGGRAHQGQVRHKIERQFGSASVGATRHHQKPLHRAIERDEALVRQWLKQEDPKIKALAQKEKAAITFGDAAPIRSDHPAGRGSGKCGATPIVQAPGARHAISLVSAINSRRHMRFMINEKGGVNAADASLPARRAPSFSLSIAAPRIARKKTNAFVETLGGK